MQRVRFQAPLPPLAVVGRAFFRQPSQHSATFPATPSGCLNNEIPLFVVHISVASVSPNLRTWIAQQVPTQCLTVVVRDVNARVNDLFDAVASTNRLFQNCPFPLFPEFTPFSSTS